MEIRKFKAGTLVKRKKYSSSRFKNSRFTTQEENFEIGIVIEFSNSYRLSESPRALVLINGKIVDTSTFFLDIVS